MIIEQIKNNDKGKAFKENDRGEGGFEFEGETEKTFRENMAAESDSKLERGGDFQISAKTKTVKNE